MEEEHVTVAEQYPENSFERLFGTSRGKHHQGVPGVCVGTRLLPNGASTFATNQAKLMKRYAVQVSSSCLHNTHLETTHTVSSEPGFSIDVDLLLMKNNMSSCLEHQKLVILLLDEMYIREDLVYDKHSGNLTGITHLGSVSNHLLASEHDGHNVRRLAKTMMVFMV